MIRFSETRSRAPIQRDELPAAVLGGEEFERVEDNLRENTISLITLGSVTSALPDSSLQVVGSEDLFAATTDRSNWQNMNFSTALLSLNGFATRVEDRFTGLMSESFADLIVESVKSRGSGSVRDRLAMTYETARQWASLSAQGQVRTLLGFRSSSSIPHRSLSIAGLSQAAGSVASPESRELFEETVFLSLREAELAIEPPRAARLARATSLVPSIPDLSHRYLQYLAAESMKEALERLGFAAASSRISGARNFRTQAGDFDDLLFIAFSALADTIGRLSDGLENFDIFMLALKTHVLRELDTESPETLRYHPILADLAQDYTLTMVALKYNVSASLANPMTMLAKSASALESIRSWLGAERQLVRVTVDAISQAVFCHPTQHPVTRGLLGGVLSIDLRDLTPSETLFSVDKASMIPGLGSLFSDAGVRMSTALTSTLQSLNVPFTQARHDSARQLLGNALETMDQFLIVTSSPVAALWPIAAIAASRNVWLVADPVTGRPGARAPIEARLIYEIHAATGISGVHADIKAALCGPMGMTVDGIEPDAEAENSGEEGSSVPSDPTPPDSVRRTLLRSLDGTYFVRDSRLALLLAGGKFAEKPLEVAVAAPPADRLADRYVVGAFPYLTPIRRSLILEALEVEGIDQPLELDVGLSAALPILPSAHLVIGLAEAYQIRARIDLLLTAMDLARGATVIEDDSGPLPTDGGEPTDPNEPRRTLSLGPRTAAVLKQQLANHLVDLLASFIGNPLTSTPRSMVIALVHDEMRKGNINLENTRPFQNRLLLLAVLEMVLLGSLYSRHGLDEDRIRRLLAFMDSTEVAVAMEATPLSNLLTSQSV